MLREKKQYKQKENRRKDRRKKKSNQELYQFKNQLFKGLWSLKIIKKTGFSGVLCRYKNDIVSQKIDSYLSFISFPKY